MRKLLLSVALCVSLGFSGTSFGFVESPTQTPQKQEVFRSVVPSSKIMSSLIKKGDILKGLEMVSLTSDGSRLSSLRGNLTDPISGDLINGAKSYILSNSELFNLPSTRAPEVIKQVNLVEENGCTHVTFGMNLNGVRVRDGLIQVNIGQNKVIQLVNGSFPTVEEITNQTSIAADEAIALAQKAVGATSLRGKAKAELVVLPQDNGKAIMAYEVQIPSENPLGDFEVLINASNGQEVSRLNQMVFADSVAGEVTGVGSVYLINPLVSQITNENLPHLTSTSLKGAYANVLNGKGDVAVSENHQFIFTADDTHFDEANEYFYITGIHDFHGTLGFHKLDRPMKATVHYGDKFDNAYYSPQTDEMCFGDGNKLNDLGKEGTVCYHEYSHACLQQIVSLTYKGESGAMNEGQADYFACSLANDPKLGAWTVAKMGKPWIRNLSDKLHYPEDIGHEVHQDGRIWGCVLWDLRTALGTNACDMIVQKSFYSLKSGSPSFIDGMNSIITADQQLNNGANKDTIIKVFAARGISSQAASGTSFTAEDLKTMKTFRTVHGEN
ncbi:MAG: M36 family metallopeptidase [Candidatus Riflebacteria bacterium]|nr:M36 family metallopeptidase [Candidatus Riflebacteria bacterium]